MDVQLQELIEKIKKDGIESAASDAKRVKEEAEKEAAQIVAAAKKEADAIISKGKADAERSEQASIAAVEQASRNLVLSFRSQIEELLSSLVKKASTEAYDDGVLKAAIPDIVKAWAKGADELELLLPKENLSRLEAFFKDALASELKKGIELKADRNLGAGFRIAAKDGSAYYDFSAEAVAELLSAYLNPRLAESLKTAVKGM
ncbi:V-type ATP synthase subunit E [Treponema sp.]